VTDDLQVHPADVLALQLDRVSGLVRTLGDLYSPQQESFAAGNTFIAHALGAVSTLVRDAQGALEDLHDVCDLRPIAARAERANTPAQRDDEQANVEPLVFPPPEAVWTEDPQQNPITRDVAAPIEQDEFAQSYLELLRKLTAAEVFAAEQQALAPPGTGQNLLPLLRSLREEFQKLHKVA
jgi:hypothetical protein